MPVKYRVATHLEDLENREKSGNLRVVGEESGKVCSCIWSYYRDTKCAKRNFLLGKVVHHMKSERRKDAYSTRCKLCLKTFSLSNMGKQAVISHTRKKFWTCIECSRKVREFDDGHPVTRS